VGGGGWGELGDEPACADWGGDKRRFVLVRWSRRRLPELRVREGDWLQWAVFPEEGGDLEGKKAEGPFFGASAHGRAIVQPSPEGIACVKARQAGRGRDGTLTGKKRS